MEISLHLITGKISPDYTAALNEYTKRISPFAKINIKTYKNLNKLSIHSKKQVIVIKAGESTLDSVEFSKYIEQISVNGLSSLEVIIASLEQLDTIIKILDEQAVDYEFFNISSFDMSTEMTATVLIEQIYRAYTILNNIKYHK